MNTLIKKMRSILAIDDNEINRKYVQTVLRSVDRKVHLAESGSKGLQLARKLEIDLILIDIQMPSMDGFKCFDIMKTDLGLKIPILAISAYSDDKDRTKFIEYGFDDYITKPVKPKILQNIVEYWLKQSNRIEQIEDQSSSPDLNIKIIEELKRYAGKEELIELYNEFIEETNELNEKLLFLQNSEDHTEILSILHTTKGNAGSLGFSRLSEVVALLEKDLKSKNDVSLPERIEEIISYTSELFKNYDKQTNFNL